MKKKLHIHSDNSKWAGCENMPGIFLQDQKLNSIFDITFSYRYSHEYEYGMTKWIKNLNTLDFNPLFYWKDINNTLNPIETYPLHFSISYLYKIRPYFKPIMALRFLVMLNEVIKLFRLFKRIEPDILHINNGGYPGASSCNSAAIAGKLAGINKITYMINSTTIDHWYDRPMTWLVKKSVTKFICASKHLKNKSDFLRIETDMINNFEVIPNTIKYQIPVKREAVRRRFDIKKDQIFFLAVGVDEERKGFKLLEKAFDLQQRYNKKSKLIIQTGQLKNIDDYSLINACDVLIVPSLYDEDFPNVILIAMMYGRPVIASNIAGIPEIINGNNGDLFDAGDMDELIYWLNYSGNKSYPNVKGREAKRTFDDNYSNEKIIDRYIELWNQDE